MTSLQIMALAMPFAVLALVAIVAVISRRQDGREERGGAH